MTSFPLTIRPAFAGLDEEAYRPFGGSNTMREKSSVGFDFDPDHPSLAESAALTLVRPPSRAVPGRRARSVIPGGGFQLYERA